MSGIYPTFGQAFEGEIGSPPLNEKVESSQPDSDKDRTIPDATLAEIQEYVDRGRKAQSEGDDATLVEINEAAGKLLEKLGVQVPAGESVKRQPMTSEEIEQYVRAQEKSGNLVSIGANGRQYSDRVAADNSLMEAKRQSSGTIQILVEDLLKRAQDSTITFDKRSGTYSAEGDFFSRQNIDAVTHRLNQMLGQEAFKDAADQTKSNQEIAVFLDQYNRWRQTQASTDLPEELGRRLDLALQFLDPSGEIRRSSAKTT
jgi:hypothetical protein